MWRKQHHINYGKFPLCQYQFWTEMCTLQEYGYLGDSRVVQPHKIKLYLNKPTGSSGVTAVPGPSYIIFIQSLIIQSSGACGSYYYTQNKLIILKLSIEVGK